MTGATGLVGGHVAAALIQKGYRVRAAVRDPSNEKKVAYLKTLGCQLAKVPDLLLDDGWNDAMAGCDGLAHIASPVFANLSAEEMTKQAVGGVERALNAAAKAGTVKRVVVTATMASICGNQRDSNPDHLWSEADKNNAPGSAYSKSKTAAEERTWQLAEQHKDKYTVTTIHPGMVIGALVPGQNPTSTMGYLKNICEGAIFPMKVGVCDPVDVANAHVAGLELEETAGERYIVCSRDQYTTLEIAEMVVASHLDLAQKVALDKWRADEKVKALGPAKKPSTDNRKLCALFGVEDLMQPQSSVAAAVQSMKLEGHLSS